MSYQAGTFDPFWFWNFCSFEIFGQMKSAPGLSRLLSWIMRYALGTCRLSVLIDEAQGCSHPKNKWSPKLDREWMVLHSKPAIIEISRENLTFAEIICILTFIFILPYPQNVVSCTTFSIWNWYARYYDLHSTVKRERFFAQVYFSIQQTRQFPRQLNRLDQ